MSCLLARKCCLLKEPMCRWVSVLALHQGTPCQIENKKPICIHQARHLHVSKVMAKMVKKKPDDIGRRKGTQEDDFVKKKQADKTPTAYLKVHMTVKEVAEKLKVPVDDVIISILEITDKNFQADQQIKDEHILEQIATLLDRKFKIVKVNKLKAAEEVRDEPEDIVENLMKKHGKKETAEIIEKPENSDPVVKQKPPNPAKLVLRPPVVTIMGHVDHGKTTLLDSLRESRVVDQEYGGITQHIGAFNVKLPSGHSITFLDTPGHAAFSSMRARGASVTDIVVLVIAIEDGIMPQTVESIKHAQDSNVPLIIAVNKIDKFGSDMNMIKSMLSVYGVTLEEYGGDVQLVPISALKRINLDKLEDCITTLAELLELKGDPVGLVEGRIIETKTDPKRGKLATMLIQRGTLKTGNILLAGTAWTRVPAMYDNSGQMVKEVGLSMPVEIAGWKELPQVGDEVLQVKSQKIIKRAIQFRENQKMLEKGEEDFLVIQEMRSEERELYLQKRAEKKKFLRETFNWGSQYTSITRAENLKGAVLIKRKGDDIPVKQKFYILVKGDVAGSVEAILNTLATFHSNICELDVMHNGVGDVTQHDIDLAEAFDADIYAFNVGMASQIDASTVKVKFCNVIYRLFEDLIDRINEQLPDVVEEEILGEADILEEYKITVKKDGRNTKVWVAGCRCTSGQLDRHSRFKVLRGNDIIYDGDLSSLKHFKEEVSTIKEGQECGLGFNLKTLDFTKGDVVICYKNSTRKQTLDWEPPYLDQTLDSANQRV